MAKVPRTIQVQFRATQAEVLAFSDLIQKKANGKPEPFGRMVRRVLHFAVNQLRLKQAAENDMAGSKDHGTKTVDVGGAAPILQVAHSGNGVSAPRAKRAPRARKPSA